MKRNYLRNVITQLIIENIFGVAYLKEDSMPANNISEPDSDEPVQPTPPQEPEQPLDKPEDPKPGDPQTKEITRKEAVDIIFATKGKFFTVLFIKKNGQERVMNARLGVKKYLHGGSLRYDPIAKGLLPVLDVQIQEYRMINFNTLKMVKIGKITYKVIGG